MMKVVLLLLLGSGSLSGCRHSSEAAAIKQVLEQASASWRAGNVSAHAACWHIQPYSRILISLANGRVLDVPPARMLEASAEMGHGGHEENTNYRMHIAGSTAWVSHDEEITAQDGHKTFAHAIRLLEKVGDQWKLVGQSIHVDTRSRLVASPSQGRVN
jgi:hypothetical protein